MKDINEQDDVAEILYKTYWLEPFIDNIKYELKYWKATANAARKYFMENGLVIDSKKIDYVAHKIAVKFAKTDFDRYALENNIKDEMSRLNEEDCSENDGITSAFT